MAAVLWTLPIRKVRHRLARDIVFLEAVGINPVVVHGGGKAITRALEAAGMEAKFVQGQRVTDAATAQVVDRVLSREINPDIVAAIQEYGGKARGFPGTGIFGATNSNCDRGRRITSGSSVTSIRSKSRRCGNAFVETSRRLSVRRRSEMTDRFTIATPTLPLQRQPLR